MTEMKTVFLSSTGRDLKTYRDAAYKAIVDGKMIPEPGIPESFNVIVNELKSLGLDVDVETDEGELKAIFESQMRNRQRPRAFVDTEADFLPGGES